MLVNYDTRTIWPENYLAFHYFCKQFMFHNLHLFYGNHDPFLKELGKIFWKMKDWGIEGKMFLTRWEALSS